MPTASNDTGHKVAARHFAVGQSEKLVDFGYRAMHEMRKFARRHSFRPSTTAHRDLSYYQGCSTGGRQGMMEAQRYPEDLMRSSPARRFINVIHLNVSQVSLQVDLLRNQSKIVAPEKVRLFANAVNGRMRRERRSERWHHQRTTNLQV
jgi:feruloyl esterase